MIPPIIGLGPRDRTSGVNGYAGRFPSKTLRAGDGFLAQSSKWIHFGLGEAQRIDRAIVHWSGGEAESFAGLAVARRYELVQGSGETRESRRGPSELALSPSVLGISKPHGRARIPLVTPLPKPTVVYLDFENSRRVVRTGLGPPILIILWGSGSGDCLEDLKAFAEREKDIRAAGIGILALNVDGLADERSDVADARRSLTRLKFPFPKEKDDV